jgi:hypothetical protein
MPDVVLLDAGPLGMVAHPRPAEEILAWQVGSVFPQGKVSFELANRPQERLILQIPQGLVPGAGGHEGQVRDQLTKPHFRRQLAQPRQARQHLLASWFDHGSKSSIVGHGAGPGG